jgi:hypothetical protein
MAMKRKTKVMTWTGAIVLALLALATVLWVRRFHRYTPIEVVQDLRAAAASKTDPRPVERFLELRYGPLTEPANRQKAFLDYFNLGHIEGLRLIVHRAPAAHRPVAIAGMAQWVANYRQGMSPEERLSLAAFLRTAAGQRMVQEATAKYLSQDVDYRAATAPVIRELMATLAEVQKP